MEERGGGVGKTYFPVTHVHPHGLGREVDVEDCMVEAIGEFFLWDNISDYWF